MAMLRIRKPDGSIVEIASLPGKKGDDGHTPQKGVDYFTAEEQEAFLASAKEYTDEKTAPATEMSHGTVKCATNAVMASITTGIYINEQGMLTFTPATTGNIDARSPYLCPITPSNLDYAVKVGITTNVNTLTDEEKAAAQEWLGMTEKLGDIDTALDAILAMQENLIGGDA